MAPYVMDVNDIQPLPLTLPTEYDSVAIKLWVAPKRPVDETFSSREALRHPATPSAAPIAEQPTPATPEPTGPQESTVPPDRGGPMSCLLPALVLPDVGMPGVVEHSPPPVDTVAQHRPRDNGHVGQGENAPSRSFEPPALTSLLRQSRRDEESLDEPPLLTGELKNPFSHPRYNELALSEDEFTRLMWEQMYEDYNHEVGLQQLDIDHGKDVHPYPLGHYARRLDFYVPELEPRPVAAGFLPTSRKKLPSQVFTRGALLDYCPKEEVNKVISYREKPSNRNQWRLRFDSEVWLRPRATAGRARH